MTIRQLIGEVPGNLENSCRNESDRRLISRIRELFRTECLAVNIRQALLYSLFEKVVLCPLPRSPSGVGSFETRSVPRDGGGSDAEIAGMPRRWRLWKAWRIGCCFRRATLMSPSVATVAC